MSVKSKAERDQIQYRQDRKQEVYLYRPVPPVADAIRVAFCYPAAYSIAMSSLGFMLLFRLMDMNPEIDVSRVTMDNLDSFHPQQFEVMGFSFSFELDTVNILKTLETWNIPFYASQRERSHPFVFSGGPTPMSNPEPYAEFFDFFLIGEGEELMTEALLCIKRYRDEPDRHVVLRKLAAEVPGVYVPCLYQVEYYSDDGPISSITTLYPETPLPAMRRIVDNMSDHVAATPILTHDAIYKNTLLLEVMRGCAHRCRFCLASYTTLPARGGTLDKIIEKLEAALPYTQKIGLLGALISDHPEFPELCQYLDRKIDTTPGGLQLSSSSLRADTLTRQIAETFKKGGQKQLTLAVETGSERLRRRINKNLKTDEIFNAVQVMCDAGLKGVKLYGMVGLPGEQPEHVLETVQLLKDLHKAFPKTELHLGVSSFVPKGGTPFQWMPKIDNKTVDERYALLKKSLLKVADVRAGSAKWDFFQALLSRGDRRLSRLLVRFYQLGGSLGAINRAYKELKAEGQVNFPSLSWYAERERPESEILPWDVINLGIAKSILWKEGLPPPGFENSTPPPPLETLAAGL